VGEELTFEGRDLRHCFRHYEFLLALGAALGTSCECLYWTRNLGTKLWKRRSCQQWYRAFERSWLAHLVTAVNRFVMALTTVSILRSVW